MIKKWEDRRDIHDYHAGPIRNTVIHELMQAEIDELRAALLERDAEIDRLKSTVVYRTLNATQGELSAQRNVLEQALEALQTCRIRSVTEGEVREVTPKIITNAITAIQEQLK